VQYSISILGVLCITALQFSSYRSDPRCRATAATPSLYRFISHLASRRVPSGTQAGPFPRRDCSCPGTTANNTHRLVPHRQIVQTPTETSGFRLIDVDDTALNTPEGSWGTPAQFTYGNAGRRILRGPDRTNVDFFSFSAVHRWRKKFTLQLRAEFCSLGEPPAVRPAWPDHRQPQRGCDYGGGGNAALLRFGDWSLHID